jgi:hypothetical protein
LYLNVGRILRIILLPIKRVEDNEDEDMDGYHQHRQTSRP